MPLPFHDQQHIARLLLQEQRVSALFNTLIAKVSPDLRRWTDNGGNTSVWVRNAAIEKLVDYRLIEFQSELTKLINSDTLGAWNLSGDKNDELVKQFVDGLGLKQLVKDGFFNRNMDAFKAFQQRADNGLTLSDRVFSTAIGAKGQMEFYLKSGIGTGRSADQISRDIRQLLVNPDARFRRIRNEAGQLVTSQPMKNYHPGQGVYRSAYKNALRIAGTETNMAYRTADHERWKQLDFVLGFEVKRSRNGEPCVVCDALKGKYPKEFLFPGWHPHCICYAVPVLMDHNDSADFLLTKYSRKYREKKGVSADSFKPDYITEIPKSAQIFIKNNPLLVDKSHWGRANASFLHPESVALGKQMKFNFDSNLSGKYVQETKESALTKLANLKTHEEVYSILKDGQVYWKKSGIDKHRVVFSDEETKLLKGAELYHNHPVAGYAALSYRDIHFMINHDLKSITSVSENELYTALKQKNSLNVSLKEFEKLYNEVENEVEASFGRMSSDKYREFLSNPIHYVNIEFCKKYKITYIKGAVDTQK